MRADYARGAERERRVAGRLRARGWDVIRSAGSKGPIDLLAYRRGEVLAVSVKADRHAHTHAELHTLWVLCDNMGWTPILADHDGYWQLTADHHTRDRLDTILTEWHDA